MLIMMGTSNFFGRRLWKGNYALLSPTKVAVYDGATNFEFTQCDGATDHHAVHSAPAAVRWFVLRLPVVVLNRPGEIKDTEVLSMT